MGSVYVRVGHFVQDFYVSGGGGGGGLLFLGLRIVWN